MTGLVRSIVIFGAFAAGASAGILGTRSFFKKKYEDLYNKETEDMRMFYAKKRSELHNDERVKEEKADLAELASKYLPGDKPVAEYGETVENFKSAWGITDEDFENMSEEMDVVYWSYYTEDDVVTDEKGHIIEDWEKTVGADAFDEDCDTCWHVKNPNNDYLYEIEKIDGSYAELVQGIGEPVENRYVRNKRALEEEDVDDE